MSMKSERSLIALFPLAAYGRASYARTDHLCHPEGAYPRRGAAAARARRARAFGRVFRQEKQSVSFWDKPAANLAYPRARLRHRELRRPWRSDARTRPVGRKSDARP